MLYIVDNFDPSQQNIIINQGHLAVTPFVLGIGQAFKITAVVTADCEDFSLKVWISKQPGSPSVVLTPPNLTEWHPGKIPLMPVTVVEMTHPMINDISVLPLLAGNYYINVLNLINQQNAFAMAIIPC